MWKRRGENASVSLDDSSSFVLQLVLPHAYASQVMPAAAGVCYETPATTQLMPV